MYSLVILSALALTASAATPFFESPDNPRAAPFYKVPINRDFSSPSGYNQQRSSGSFNSYKQSGFGQSDFYKPQPSFYKPEPSFYKPEPSFYKPQPSSFQPSYGGQGSSSFQTIRIGGQQGYSHFRPNY